MRTKDRDTETLSLHTHNFEGNQNLINSNSQNGEQEGPASQVKKLKRVAGPIPKQSKVCKDKKIVSQKSNEVSAKKKTSQRVNIAEDDVEISVQDDDIGLSEAEDDQINSESSDQAGTGAKHFSIEDLEDMFLKDDDFFNKLMDKKKRDLEQQNKEK